VLPAWGIEADRPEDGKRLYGYGDQPDTFMATRMREDGQYEHTVLDEYGMPTEWRLVYKPQFS
jgi:hypothetical protein